jgi:signal transduction histidine kinase
VQESLLELKKASQILYTDVREEIFNLRTAVPERTDFFSNLQEYLANYQTHYGLNANILVERECPSEFSPEVAGQLLRIIQEALANVRRHSDAGKVLIHCMSGEEQVCISIEDDGRGFYPAQVAANGGQSYGLQIMRERAESVGGSLEVDSQPGQGTRVVVRVPSSY